MSRISDFLQECGVFYVLTMDGDFPAGRPFGAVMEYDDKLYLSTANTKDVYRQIRLNPNIQIVALKAGTRDWIRIRGKACESRDLVVKARMLHQFPILTRHFASADCEAFALVAVEVLQAHLHTGNEILDLSAP